MPDDLANGTSGIDTDQKRLLPISSSLRQSLLEELKSVRVLLRSAQRQLINNRRVPASSIRELEDARYLADGLDFENPEASSDAIFELAARIDQILTHNDFPLDQRMLLGDASERLRTIFDTLAALPSFDDLSISEQLVPFVYATARMTLHVFLEVARTGSIDHAAAVLGLSRALVIDEMRWLDEQAPAKLFEGGDIVRLSTAGRDFRSVAFARLHEEDTSRDPVEGARRVQQITPDQQSGPVRFEVVDGVVRVLHSDDRAAEANDAGADAARDGLLAGGSALLDELRRSNCDRRLLGSFEALQAKLEAKQDVVQLGILNIACENLREAFKQELPDALTALLKAHAIGISLYLGQFEQWSRFVENAASVEIMPEDVPVIHKAAVDAVEGMKGREDVDPEVPKLIKFLMRSIDNPKGEAKRAAFAVLRTIENFVAAVYNFAADFVIDSATQTRTKAAKVISTALVASLLTIAAHAAGGIGPIAGRVMGSEWMQNAAEAVEKQIEGLTGK